MTTRDKGITLNNLPLAVNVCDRPYLADPTGVADSTAAFAAAIAAGPLVYIPPGTYKISSVALANGTRIVGAGQSAVTIQQSAAAQSPFTVTTSSGTGNWQGLEISKLTIKGAATPTAPAVQISCSGAGALWRCKFEYSAKDTYQAINVSSVGTNFFDNDILVTSEGTVTTAAYCQSGTYNRWVLFLTQCLNSIALDHGGVDDVIYCVADGQIKDSGLNTTIYGKVEYLYGTNLSAGEACISLTGTNQTLISPTVNLPSGSASKCSFGIKPSNGTTVINPYFLSDTVILANPFNVNAGFYWTLIGGQSNCTNKLETTYDGTSDTKSLRRVAMIGDVSQLSARGNTHGGKVIQYKSSAVNFAVDLDPNTDVLICDLSAVIANGQINMIYGLQDGRVITVTATNTITAINWVSGANVTQLPATLAAGARVSFVYNASLNKFFLV